MAISYTLALFCLIFVFLYGLLKFHCVRHAFVLVCISIDGVVRRCFLIVFILTFTTQVAYCEDLVKAYVSLANQITERNNLENLLEFRRSHSSEYVPVGLPLPPLFCNFPSSREFHEDIYKTLENKEFLGSWLHNSEVLTSLGSYRGVNLESFVFNNEVNRYGAGKLYICLIVEIFHLQSSHSQLELLPSSKILSDSIVWKNF
jgi:hypothetical protein